MLSEVGAPEEAGEELFPPGPRQGNCRICGTFADLTEEHLPPRGAFNNRRGRDVPVEALLGREELDDPEEGRWVQGGIRGHVLCHACNNRTGRFGREYQEWAGRAMYLLSRQPILPPEVDERAGWPSFPSVTFERVYPGRLVRQVLSMMLTISASPSLARRYPDLAELALGEAPRPLPEPLRLYFLLYGDYRGRIVGGPQGQIWFDGDGQVLRRVLSIDFPPLAFILSIAGPPIEDVGVDISVFSEYALDRRCDVTFTDLQLGFGHKPWPCDYRTKGQLIADRVPVDEG